MAFQCSLIGLRAAAGMDEADRRCDWFDIVSPFKNSHKKSPYKNILNLLHTLDIYYKLKKTIVGIDQT